MIQIGNNLGISQKLIISFTFIFIVAITLTGILIYNGIPFTEYKGQIKENEHEFFKDLDFIANVKKDQILHWIDDCRKDIEVFSQIQNIVNRTAILHEEFANQAVDESDPLLSGTFDKKYIYDNLLAELNMLLNISDWYSSITIVDSESGHVIISTDKGLLGVDLSDEEFFLNTLKTRSVSITESKYELDDEGRHIHIGKVIEDGNRTPVGVMVFCLNYKTFGARLIGNFNGAVRRIETKLINSDSVILLPLENNLISGAEAEVFSYKLETLPALLAAKGEDGFLEASDYRGEKVFSAYRSIPINTDWGLGLVLSRKSEELYYLIRKQVITAIIISGFITLLLILVVIFLSGKITKPIKDLMKASEQVMPGNFNIKGDIRDNDELGKLTRSFNRMTGFLLELRENLEVKVMERTRSLETEISERRSAEESMRKFSYAVEQSASVIIILDNDYNIEYVNPMFTHISGYSKEDVIGKNPDFLNIGDYSSERRKKMMHKVFGGQIQKTVFHNKKKDGEEYWVSVSISGIKDANGVLTNILEVQEDITEQRGLKEQLVQAQKMEAIGTLAGGVAHDFNNILSVVLGYSEYLLSKLDKEDNIYPMMEDIREASKRGASLTGQLLAFSRKQTVQMAALDLNDILKGIRKMLIRLIGENVKLSLNMEENLWTIEADHGQLDQVLMNIAVNSSHAMPEGGALTISSGNIDSDISNPEFSPQSGSGKFVFLSIKDTGCGMDESTISRIFDPFFTTKPIGMGTGLGLSVVYGIVEQHKGWINVKSKPGKGTEFKIFFPVLKKQKQFQSEPERQSAGKPGKGERILLVEDDRALRNFAVRVLTENGYNVFSATAVTEVFDMFDVGEGAFDLVFTDVILPDFNGIKLVEFLLERNAELKVLLTSGYTDEKSHRIQIQEKGYNFLQKPYTMDNLLNKIAEVLGEGQDYSKNLILK